MKDARRNDELLIIFGKASVPGEVKTRLVPPLTSDEAAELNLAFTLDLIARHVNTGKDLILYLSADEESFVAEKARLAQQVRMQVGADIDIRRQTGRGLGARLLDAFTRAFEAGYDSVVILGSDHPSLPPHLIDRAFESLRDGPVAVLGPAEDGGYCFVGMDRVLPEAFEDMTYSHDRVLPDTLDRLRQTGVRTVLLDEWYDVDDETGLNRLTDDLASGRAGDLPHTAPVLDRVGAAMRKRMPAKERT